MLHNPTLFFVMTLLNAFMSILFLAMGLTIRRRKWLFIMSLEAFLIALTTPLFLMHGHWPLLLTTLTPNIVQFIAVGLIMLSVDSFMERKNPLFVYFIPAGIIAVTFLPLLLVWDSFFARTVIVTFSLLFMFLHMGWTVFHGRPRNRFSKAYVVISILVSLLGLTMFGRLAFILLSGVNPEFGSRDFQFMYFLVSAIISTAGFTGVIILMTAVANEKELEENIEKVTEMNNNRDRLLSILSHDMRGSLGIIEKMLGHFVRNDATGMKRESADMMKKIHALSREQLETLSNILVWLKARRDGIKPCIEALNLDRTLSDSYNLYSEMARAKGVTMDRVIGQGMEVNADAEMLKTVVRNLLSNAVKFTDSGGAVRLEARKDENCCVLTVTDTGVGFNAEWQSRMPLGAGETVGTAGEKGTGLGLQLCRDMMENMGGEMLIESERGRGTKVTLRLCLERKCGGEE